MMGFLDESVQYLVRPVLKRNKQRCKSQGGKLVSCGSNVDFGTTREMRMVGVTRLPCTVSDDHAKEVAIGLHNGVF